MRCPVKAGNLPNLIVDWDVNHQHKQTILLFCISSVLSVVKRLFSTAVGTLATVTTRVSRPTGPPTCTAVYRRIKTR